jgi:hypothetical protein
MPKRKASASMITVDHPEEGVLFPESLEVAYVMAVTISLDHHGAPVSLRLHDVVGGRAKLINTVTVKATQRSH